MLKSIWMNAWDLAGTEPSEMVAFLKSCGLTACNLGFSYHGGRMLLPGHHQHKVYEQKLSALYFPAKVDRYKGFRLQPQVAPEAKLVQPFIAECVKADFEVNAWIVLCHNDQLGMDAPECSIENVFGDKYTYALCPSNPEVRRYIVALCADIAAFDGVAKLDLEALSFLGYEHASLHDKRGVPLTPFITWLLSVCVCFHCRQWLGDFGHSSIARRARAVVNAYFEELPEADSSISLREELEIFFGTAELANLLERRRAVLVSLIDEIRARTNGKHLNLRLATSPLFCGGKSALRFADLPNLVDSATVTFLGASKEEMKKELNTLPSKERSVPLYGGLMFHYPDCRSEADVRERVALLDASRVDGQIFYGYSMAASKHFAWMRNVLTKE